MEKESELSLVNKVWVGFLEQFLPHDVGELYSAFQVITLERTTLSLFPSPRLQTPSSKAISI